jgi:hypothetical protein
MRGLYSRTFRKGVVHEQSSVVRISKLSTWLVLEALHRVLVSPDCPTLRLVLSEIDIVRSIIANTRPRSYIMSYLKTRDVVASGESKKSARDIADKGVPMTLPTPGVSPKGDKLA